MAVVDAPARHDWARIERSPEYRELVARRRRFVVPATLFFLAWYFGFVVLAGYAEGFMGESIYEGFTVGYALALTQFAMVAGLGLGYLSYSSRVLDPLRARVVALAERDGGVPDDEPRTPVTGPETARFERGPTPTRGAAR